ncbi:LysR family transcriptional regulator [Pseudomonas sp. B21-056]|jgi:DNA-binding transcriptional LysR family regulator|uniref:LysR family transcriptional regulator n=1 Tax=Pseudomonas sp. B21-056 TaxID=2895495 RepID=UPI002231F327|nr:LysR family transcriptional regulator [Pseudomonas sp. B21-056]UZE22470.1 LysR family transcriptional regulator [Pseudomonas sp. B21-056]
MSPAFNNLSISQLKALVTILEVPHLSRAAIILGTSQSTLSRHLALFREVLGDPLLVRQGREYTLTERGHQLLEPLKNLLEQIDGLGSPAIFSPATCNRRFILAGSDYVAQYILPDLLRDLAGIAPDVSIDFRTWQPNRFDWLSSGKVDLITSMIDETPADYHGRIIGEDVAVCCMRTSHPLAVCTTISQRDYLAWPHIKITVGGDKDGFVDAHLRKQQLARNLKLSVPYYCAALSVLQQSDALLTLPEHIARRWAEQAEICFRPLSFIEHQFRYWVVWHSRSQTSAEQQWFRQFVYQHCRGSQFLSPGDHLPHGRGL